MQTLDEISKNSDLYRAIRWDFANADEVISEAKLSTPDLEYGEHHRTLLHLAAKESPVSLNLLMNLGIKSLDARDSYGFTPIHLAVINCDRKCFDALELRGAHLDNVNNDGINLYHSASKGDNIEIIKALLEKGIEGFDTPDNRGLTPLAYALHHGYEKIALRLLDAGADTSEFEAFFEREDYLDEESQQLDPKVEPKSFINKETVDDNNWTVFTHTFHCCLKEVKDYHKSAKKKRNFRNFSTSSRSVKSRTN